MGAKTTGVLVRLSPSHIISARTILFSLFVLAMLLLGYRQSYAQEYPYFVTYSQEMEEPGNLDIESFNVIGTPAANSTFIGSNLEFEYGVKAWWTTEFYLDGQ